MTDHDHDQRVSPRDVKMVACVLLASLALHLVIVVVARVTPYTTPPPWRPTAEAIADTHTTDAAADDVEPAGPEQPGCGGQVTPPEPRPVRQACPQGAFSTDGAVAATQPATQPTSAPSPATQPATQPGPVKAPAIADRPDRWRVAIDYFLDRESSNGRDPGWLEIGPAGEMAKAQITPIFILDVYLISGYCIAPYDDESARQGIAIWLDHYVPRVFPQALTACGPATVEDLYELYRRGETGYLEWVSLTPAAPDYSLPQPSPRGGDLQAAN